MIDIHYNFFFLDYRRFSLCQCLSICFWWATQWVMGDCICTRVLSSRRIWTISDGHMIKTLIGQRTSISTGMIKRGRGSEAGTKKRSYKSKTKSSKGNIFSISQWLCVVRARSNWFIFDKYFIIRSRTSTCCVSYCYLVLLATAGHFTTRTAMASKLWYIFLNGNGATLLPNVNAI